jgi:hypothetical protein
MFIARRLTFYPGYFEDKCEELSDEIILPSYHLNKLIEQFDDDEMLYVDMTNSNTNQSYLVAIGSSHSYDKNTIYVPQWILDIIGCTGCCDSVITIKKADVKDIPSASKIIIKPLDPIAFEMNTLEIFEKALMNLHSIKEGITLPILVSQLGNDYTMFSYIEKVEPLPLSRIIHGEVDVEFINEFKEEVPKVSNSLVIPDGSPQIIPSNSIITPISSITAPQISTEERRQQVRESWLKRFQCNAPRQ